MSTPQYFSSLESAVSSLFGEGTKIEQTRRISGGDSNEAYGLTLTGGKYIFMKCNTKENLPFFTAEAAGLHAIARTEAIGTGRILPDSWIGFFRDCRLAPQFQDADRYFDREDRKKILRLLDHLDEILVEPQKPSLLHGDLWAGNVITGNDGRAWLIDPAVSVGHAEADIAMTELFGGFPSVFYDAYKAAAPMQPGYERRRDVYNLYHLLNHLNMFGRTYLPEVKYVMERALQSL